MAVAAYARIAEDLRGKITSRDIKPGGQLPSELELRDQYKASRNTVLDAIKKLKDEGLVETRPGQGWFARVRIVPFVNPLELGRQRRDRARRRLAAGLREGEPPTVSLQAAAPEMADRLCVPAGTAMIVRRQEWFLDEVPWKLQAVWCPKALFDEGAHRLLMAEDISEGLGSYLQEALGLRLAGADVLLLAAQAERRGKQVLRLPRRGRASRLSSNSSAPRTRPRKAARARCTRWSASTRATGTDSRARCRPRRPGGRR